MDDPAQQRSIPKYLPQPEPERRGLALCLSGGGYRAALFHLGSMRRLNELGVLAKITDISSVSGGSILAAHLATVLDPWPEAPIDDWDARVADPFKRFTNNNIRTGPVLKRLLPWNWARTSTAVEALADLYESKLTRLKVTELPQHPRFVLCATDMSFGANFVFERAWVGDYMAGYCPPPAEWLLARGVAASSCFPPIFNPLPVGLDPGQLKGGRAPQGAERDRLIKGLRLSDGGVYDNMALEPLWKQSRTLLVSDGGAPFDFKPDSGLLWRLQRYTSIVSRQASGVRKRWLISNFLAGELEGTYWGISSATGSYDGTEGYSKDLARDIVAKIRTDLDRFSDAEKSVLENHGYTLADAAVRKHAAHLIDGDPAETAIPNLHYMEEARVRSELADSHKLKLPFGRR